jgi:transcriptional regulator with XRE-family HTH domain
MHENWRDRARRRMKDVGETQNSLSEKMDMTQGGLQHWLSGNRQPALEDINRIAMFLRCPPAWLTHGLEPEDMTDGLNEHARHTLRRLIRTERQTPLPESFWSAIDAMAQTVAPAHPTAGGAETPSDHPAPRNGTDG